MSKYNFERITPEKFETLVQALLEKQFRLEGKLVQFGAGKDGGREATWTQPVDHPTYKRPITCDSDDPKQWVFQVKYHDIGTVGWGGARAEIESELDKELQKIIEKHKVPCHKYILITNVPFSGVRHVGTRDKVGVVQKKWEKKIPEIEVWDAVDLSRMLDADSDIRTTYLDEILPGDVLQAFLDNLSFSEDRRKSAFYAYLKKIINSEREAKAEEAGDKSGLKLEKIFVDLDLKLITETLPHTIASIVRKSIIRYEDNKQDYNVPDLEKIPSSFAFLRADNKFMVLKGGPGVGKSTITQFLTLYYSARLVEPSLAVKLAQRLKLTGGVSAEQLDAHCRIRFPFRVELRRYAQWMTENQGETDDTFLARYLSERVNQASSACLEMDDIFALASGNPLLLILDGLDEVPHPRLRNTIFSELAIFLNRCEAEACDIHIILSSRPQGYRGEFDKYEPMELHVLDLEQNDFTDYADRWLKERIADDNERKDARERISEGMLAHAVQQMATTLLQATVMLTIARRKHRIPHARHKLYEKYVEVIFERERNKQTVRERSEELLRLHEIVGYELISKMESAAGDYTLGNEEFKSCVQKVILDYGPSDLGNTSISNVVDDIVTLAKDRLCLLAGKGDNQQNVDFVIQPFREYFAAAYLAHHEDADPDRIYENLVERRHIWANVLQFYTAFQSNAQQKNWISEADDGNLSQFTYEDLVKLTRKRRALIRVLPEFERPKNEYIQRAFRNLLAPSTRWTWATREIENTAHLLDSFAPNDSYSLLKKLFENFSTNDLASFYVELDLLAKVASSENKNDISNLIEQVFLNEHAKSIVFQVATRNNIKLNLEDCSLEELRKMRWYQSGFNEKNFSEFLKGLSEDLIVDLTFSNIATNFKWSYLDSCEIEWIKKLSNFFFNGTHSYRLESLIISIPLFHYDNSSNDPNEFIAQLEEGNSQIGPYLVALLRAIKNPTDPDLHELAKKSEESIQEIVPEYLSVIVLLGAPPSNFDSVDSWKETRSQYMSTEFEDSLKSNWFSNISTEDDGSWLTLLINPNAWPELHPIVDENRLKRLIETAQPFCKKLSQNSILPLDFHGSSKSMYELDFFKVTSIIVEIIRKYGHEYVEDLEYAVDEWICIFHTQNVEASTAQKLLTNAIDLEKIPPSWAFLISRICSTVQNLDVSIQIDFWNRHCCGKMYWIANTPQVPENTIKQALDIGTKEATGFAAFISTIHMLDHNNMISLQLNKCVVQKLSQLINSLDLHQRFLYIRQLLELQPDFCELIIWDHPENINIIREETWYLSYLVKRFRRMVDNSESSILDDLRKKLGEFVDRRDEFPIEFSLAALDAILRIDEITTIPLNENSWKVIR